MPSEELRSMPPPITVLSADSHALFRDALRALLDVAGMQVLAVAANTTEAIDQTLRWRPQIVLIDMRLEPLGGAATTRLLAAEHPELPIVVLTTGQLDAEVADALRSGACGFLWKGEEPDVLLRAIVAWARGVPILSPELARFLLRELGGGPPDPECRTALTPTESTLLAGVVARSTSEPMAAARTLMTKLHRRYGRGGGSQRQSRVR